ncbi:hypothetical protein RJ640_002606 [Escallonia rubra]|uniref:Uncharacterized protein n=1 Tax=Escallonia rubra TaxID=112253 RepID=A0AA88UWQ3_9ASTE|nr:hypothetical protein RJ640_002606 [Escallonia rubra]
MSRVPGHIRFADRRIHHAHFPRASDLILLEHSMPMHHTKEVVRDELDTGKGTLAPIYIPLLLHSLGYGIPSSSKVVQKVDAIFEAEESLPQDGNEGNQALKQSAVVSVDPEASKDNVGSGVIISKTGQVATCAHVVAQLIVDDKRFVTSLSKCIIRFRDHTELMRASVTRVDFGCDLAILQIDDCSGNDFPCSTLAGDVKRGE